MNTINFTAKFIEKKQILKKEHGNDYKPCDVSIVELDKNDSRDVSALGKTSLDWIIQGDGILTYNIYKNAVNQYSDFDNEKEHYLAVTTQDSDYENLDYKKILGLSLFSETSSPVNEINLFEVRPNISKSLSKNREYKKAGTALLNYIQNTYTQKPIYVISRDESINFYLKNNFKPINDHSDCPYLMYEA